MEHSIGKNTLGQGGKMSVETRNFERSTHNTGYVWLNTQAPGTLVPFYSEWLLPGDKKEINLGAEIMTHPTVGPLFGWYKFQVDMFIAPIRLYHAWLQMNKFKIGLNMESVLLPYITITCRNYTAQELEKIENPDVYQINPSCILAYQGIRGIGTGNETLTPISSRKFHAIKFLAYWDIYYHYYANKQEEIGYVVHTTPQELEENVTNVEIDGVTLTEEPTVTPIPLGSNSIIKVTYTGTQDLTKVYILLDNTLTLPVTELGIELSNTGGVATFSYKWAAYGDTTAQYWRYANSTDAIKTEIKIVKFELENIVTMRENIMEHAGSSSAFHVNAQNLTPYSLLFQRDDETGFSAMQYSQEGLGIKTYQSDILQNWINTEWIDGATGISQLTAVSTAGGSFTMDVLNLAEKLYDMYNRIAVSDGTYTSFINVVYNESGIRGIINPIFVGGLSKQIEFERVVSQSQSTPSSAGGAQPLGTLGGIGRMGNKHIGGQVTLECNEYAMVIGICSITPMLTYTQGNAWDATLTTVDDLHKPSLDGIGFQELITENMAHWDTYQNATGEWVQRSAGKQPAWMWYRTNINKAYGNFAIDLNEGWMVLSRNYEPEVNSGVFRIKDLTTYIDPAKFNVSFAQTSLDSMNFWVQISVEETTRRKISARLMPNL